MKTLTPTVLAVLKFDTPGGAEAALDTLKSLRRQEMLVLQDAAVVSWPHGKKKPKTKQLMNTAGMGALGGTFWGMLFGLLFLAPFLGAAIGAAMGGLGGAFADVGIDDDFIKEVRTKVTEGTSALFILVSNVTQDRVIPALRDAGAEVIQTSLSPADEEKLRAAFAEE